MIDDRPADPGALTMTKDPTMSMTEQHQTMPLWQARDCPRCHHEIVLARDGSPTCSSYAVNWCGWELVESADPRRARALHMAIELDALRRVDW